MHDRGLKFAVAPDAEIHHKYEAGLTRTRSAAPRTMYPQLRSKAYFCVRHNLGRRRLADILAYVADYVAKERAWKRGLLNDGVDAATVERLIGEVERGAEDGVADALRLPAPSALSPSLLAAARGDVFTPFPLRLAADKRLRLCLFSREYPPQGHGGIGQWTQEVAVGLAARGHEVTVIARALEGRPAIDFVDGVWVHRIDPALDHTGRGAGVRPGAGEPDRLFAGPAPRGRAHRRPSPLRPHLRPDRRSGADGEPEARHYSRHRQPAHDLQAVAAAQARLAVAPGLSGEARRADHRLRGRVDRQRAAHPRQFRRHPRRHRGRAWPQDRSRQGRDRPARDQRPRARRRRVAARVPGEVKLLFVGRLEERKGADALLSILPDLLAAHPALVADIVGDDAIVIGERTLRRRYEDDNASRPEILARTRFHGALPRGDVLAHYAAADIFVAPSKYESFGLIFIEAMCFGKPVVAYDVGGAAELIEDGVNGLLAEAGAPQRLAACIARLVEDTALREDPRPARAREL